MASTRTHQAIARTVHVEHCMGTVFSIDIRGAGDWQPAIDAVLGWLHEVDSVFSTYRADSCISRLGRGELSLEECPPSVSEVLALCAEIERESGGYFTASPSGMLDPSAIVKGWAIEKASEIMTSHGARKHAINGGGDMQLSGQSAPGNDWRVGIADPLNPPHLAAVVTGQDCAVATSGTAERGHHIVNPVSGQPAAELASLTVVGRDLTRVDAYATAAFAMGDAARAWVETLPGYEAMAISTAGARWQTAGFSRWINTPVGQPVAR